MSIFVRFLLMLSSLFLVSCARDCHHKLLVSVKDQKMALLEDGRFVACYPISTSRYGIGDEVRSYKTPLGHFFICKKIGSGAPSGTVFKDGKPTGEILKPNTPGRDPIVTRIFWLKGKEPWNQNAYRRCIYIHGTPQESSLGLPKSYGCIRITSAAAMELDALVGKGAEVEVVEESLHYR